MVGLGGTCMWDLVGLACGTYCANYCLAPFGGDEIRERASAVISQRNVHRLDAPTGFHDNQRRYSTAIFSFHKYLYFIEKMIRLAVTRFHLNSVSGFPRKMSEIDHTSSSSWTINPSKVTVIQLSIVHLNVIEFNVFIHHLIALLTLFQTSFVLNLIRTTRWSQLKSKEPGHATQV